jgi:hypothetical protein
MAETVIALDAATGITSPAGDLAALQVEDMAKAILDGIGGETLTEPDICERLAGNRTLIAKAIRAMVDDGRLTRTGAGKRGDPYRYAATTAAQQATDSPFSPLTHIGNGANGEMEPSRAELATACERCIDLDKRGLPLAHSECGEALLALAEVSAGGAERLPPPNPEFWRTWNP